jgi:flagellar basal-body rod modification protein FlgD
MPSILNPIAPQTAPFSSVRTDNKVKANATVAGGTGTTSSSSSSQTSLSSLGSTFLSLLTQELQNQDPTAPMDSTQMVGQMISLNQLDQLASINQLLTTQFGTTNASSVGASTSN